MPLRRGIDATFSGSHAPGPEANHYTLSVFGREERRIVLALVAFSLRDAIELARACGRLWPGRLVMLSRSQYGGKWKAPPYAPPVASPDYRAARINGLSAYRRIGRRFIRGTESPDLLAIMCKESS